MPNIVGVDFESIVDGCGVRVVIFFSGCRHNCLGCHNPTSHNFNTGRNFDTDLQAQIIEYVKKTPFISGVTLSGGDPMYSAQYISPFVKHLKETVPDKDIWVYSGFLFEEIEEDKKMMKLLKLCDVLVDGKFVLDQRDTTLCYKGSRNQRIIDIQKSLHANSAVLYEMGGNDGL